MAQVAQKADGVQAARDHVASQPVVPYAPADGAQEAEGVQAAQKARQQGL